ncbi:endonuclease [Mycoplasmopsis phocirhinis]|nr:endonuclease [Mycoplasmopsis phocirhinis]
MKKYLILPLSSVLTTLPLVAAACNKETQKNEQKQQHNTKTTQQPQKDKTPDEKQLFNQDSSFAKWTLSLDNALKISPQVDENIINLIANKKLFYSFSKNAIIVANTRPKNKNEWANAPKVFEFKNAVPKYYNIAYADLNQGDKNNDEIKYEITDNELILSYKSSKYSKDSDSLISAQIYQTKFTRSNSKLGIDDNTTKQNDFETSNTIEQPKTNSTNQSSLITTNKITNGVYENLVAPSLKKAKGIKYVQNDFYASLEGKSGTELINALIKLQKQHRDSTGSYNDLYTTYEDAFTDKYYEKDGSLLDIYGENPHSNDPFVYTFNNKSGSGQEGKGWNREHLIAQSWFAKADPMRNDAHHVWPTDATVNQRHGNLPYGEVNKTTFTSKNGTKVGIGVEDNQPVTEVINEFKGDVARAFLYFTLTYKDKNLTSNNVANRFFDSQNNNSIKKPFLDTMLKWAQNDPITQFDLDRNNAIYQHQQNRNPFSDYPELIDVVFNANTEYVFHNQGFATELIFN